MKQLFLDGGVLMYPLAICFAVSVFISLERCLFWMSNNRKKNDYLLTKMKQALINNNITEFNSLASSSDYIINRVLEKLSHKSISNFKQHADIEVTKEFSKLKKGHSLLDTIIAVSPMIGILGTVIGIILSLDTLFIIVMVQQNH